MSIKENYLDIEQKVNQISNKPGTKLVKIIAVSKTFPLEKVLEAYEFGVRDFGENYAQELKNKYDELDKQKYNNINWHFIGHLQSNKVKYIAEFVYSIHTVDSLKLAQEISKQAIKFGRKINPIKILLQVHTSLEDTKSGINANEVIEIIKDIIILDCIEIIGLMTITSLTDDPKDRIPEFQLLSNLLIEVNSKLSLNLTELSMGMSDDFEYAIENGATVVRIGSAIFGERDYSNKK